MVFIYTTCATVEEAEFLGKMIIDQKLGACVDYWPVSSMYHWQGEFTKTSQIMIMIATFEPKLEVVNTLISKHHSYSTPMIAGVDVRRINRKFKEWMQSYVE